MHGSATVILADINPSSGEAALKEVKSSRSMPQNSTTLKNDSESEAVPEPEPEPEPEVHFIRVDVSKWSSVSNMFRVAEEVLGKGRCIDMVLA
jgi:hypothetical protein